MGDMWSTSLRAAMMSDWALRMEAVFEQCRRMWPLSVAVEHGRWERIRCGVRPGMVFSSVLLLRA